MTFKEEMLDRLTDIKVQLAEIRVGLHKNTEILEEHHIRSSNLEARIKPIEAHTLLITAIFKIIMALGTVGGAGSAAYHYFLSMPK